MVRTRRSLALAAALAGGISCSATPEAPSIVIVVLDTVRRDHTGLGPAGGARSCTPELDALATTAAVFPLAWSTAPWTVPAHASLFTGRLPSGHGCSSRDLRLDASVPTLAELLAPAGYQSAAFFSNPWLTDEASRLLRG
ncbi:MAG: sulfatase-like hydrolase/transferase, partial [bacterium]